MLRRELALPSQLVIPILRIFPTISTWNAGGETRKGGLDGPLEVTSTDHRPQRTEQPFLINSSKRRMRRLEMVGQIGKEYRTEDSGENGPREWNSWQNQVGTPPSGKLVKACAKLVKTCGKLKKKTQIFSLLDQWKPINTLISVLNPKIQEKKTFPCER